ncbi:hypothetical protein HLB44_21525 [Aquincola sp. S2]|uniref:Transmembrane protein n=1 Tax=Pseudaquabacterium terrae TaxID=2732868 RepID=A0ABX2ELR3_9BURK|nr:hypothetical protein [Aquabacterium terrae]NRF69588.1 hypothetical protein [Aquabacterium terrae]
MATQRTGIPAALLRGLRLVGSALLGLWILFEEWGWEPLQRALGWIGRLPLLRQLEAAITRLPPVAALLLFVLPSLLLLPVKLLALWLIAQGQALAGMAVIVIAKIVGTALVARIFFLTRPALMRLGWFARLYGRWTAWKEALLARIRASWAWRAGRVLKRGLQRRYARWRAAFGGQQH